MTKVKERPIEEMDNFLKDYANLLLDYVDKYDWNANEEFKAYLNIGWACAQRMVDCARIPIAEVRKRFLAIMNISINEFFDMNEKQNNPNVN